MLGSPSVDRKNGVRIYNDQKNTELESEVDEELEVLIENLHSQISAGIDISYSDSPDAGNPLSPLSTQTNQDSDESTYFHEKISELSPSTVEQPGETNINESSEPIGDKLFIGNEYQNIGLASHLNHHSNISEFTHNEHFDRAQRINKDISIDKLLSIVEKDNLSRETRKLALDHYLKRSASESSETCACGFDCCDRNLLNEPDQLIGYNYRRENSSLNQQADCNNNNSTDGIFEESSTPDFGEVLIGVREEVINEWCPSHLDISPSETDARTVSSEFINFGSTSDKVISSPVNSEHSTLNEPCSLVKQQNRYNQRRGRFTKLDCCHSCGSSLFIGDRNHYNKRQSRARTRSLKPRRGSKRGVFQGNHSEYQANKGQQSRITCNAFSFNSGALNHGNSPLSFNIFQEEQLQAQQPSDKLNFSQNNDILSSDHLYPLNYHYFSYDVDSSTGDSMRKAKELAKHSMPSLSSLQYLPGMIPMGDIQEFKRNMSGRRSNSSCINIRARSRQDCQSPPGGSLTSDVSSTSGSCQSIKPFAEVEVRRSRSPRLLESPVPFRSPVSQSSKIEDGLKVFSNKHFEKHIVNIKSTQTEAQKQLFTTWINHYCPNLIQDDLVGELSDGVKLIGLLAHLTRDPQLMHEYEKLKHQTQLSYINHILPTSSSRLRHISNVSYAIDYMCSSLNMKLINLNAMDIVNGNERVILGLCWNIILHFQLDQSESSQIPSSEGKFHENHLHPYINTSQSSCYADCATLTPQKQPSGEVIKTGTPAEEYVVSNGLIPHESPTSHANSNPSICVGTAPMVTVASVNRKRKRQRQKQQQKQDQRIAKNQEQSSKQIKTKAKSNDAKSDANSHDESNYLSSLARLIWHKLHAAYRASLPINIVLLIFLAGLCMVPLIHREACCELVQRRFPHDDFLLLNERPV